MSERCNDLAEELALYAEGELGAAECHELRAHLESCVSCRGLLARYDHLTNALLAGDLRQVDRFNEEVDEVGGVDGLIASLASARRSDETMDRLRYSAPPAWLEEATRLHEETTRQPFRASVARVVPQRRRRLSVPIVPSTTGVKLGGLRAAGWLFGGVALVLVLHFGSAWRETPPDFSASAVKPVRPALARSVALAGLRGGTIPTRDSGQEPDCFWATRGGTALAPAFAVEKGADDLSMELVALPSNASPPGRVSASLSRVRSGSTVVYVLARPTTSVLRDERVYLVPQLVSQAAGAKQPFLQIREVYTARVGNSPSPSSSPSHDWDRPPSTRWTVYRAISPVRLFELPCEIFRSRSPFAGMSFGPGGVGVADLSAGPDRVRATPATRRLQLPDLRRLPASWSASAREL